ncbi:MAG TPA: hypothetical protein VJU61_22115, partial [Polyangiaceae bacterium]|nr:hypothetical protein [Polyangiaceae bacterium]
PAEEGGTAGSTGMPPAVTTLAGNVRRIIEADLVASGPPNAPVQVRAAGALGTEVVATPAADGSFSLAGVLSETAGWAAVGAFTDPPTEPFMDTLQGVDTAAEAPVTLLVMPRAVMDDIALTSFFTTPLELDPNRGHAILTFVDELGNPLPGVRLTFPSPDDVGIAYDAGDIYSDAEIETSVRGTVVLLNLAAATYPGSLSSVVAELPTLPDRQFRPGFRVAASSVTLLTVELDLSPVGP